MFSFYDFATIKIGNGAVISFIRLLEFHHFLTQLTNSIKLMFNPLYISVEIALKTVMYALLMVQEALRSSPSTPPVQQVQIEVNVKISVAIEAVLPEEDEER